jgi:hypothetical protein
MVYAVYIGSHRFSAFGEALWVVHPRLKMEAGAWELVKL